MRKLLTIEGTPANGKDIVKDLARNLVIAGVTALAWNVGYRALMKKILGI